MPYQDAFQFLVDLGFVDVILPFLLVFLIVFSYLQRTKVLGETAHGQPKRRINAMMAFVFGFLTVLTTSQLEVLGVITSYLVLLIVVGLFIALLLGLAGAKLGKPGTFVTGIAVAIFVLTVLYALGQAGVVDSSTVDALFWPIIFVIALASVIAYVFRKGPAQQRAAPQRPQAQRQAPESAGPPGPGHLQVTQEEAEEINRHIAEVLGRRRQQG